MNFDNQYLYCGNDKIKKMKGYSLYILEYLCMHPNCYKKISDIRNYLGGETLNENTVRAYISKLINSHYIFKEVIQSQRNAGYKYIGGEAINNFLISNFYIEQLNNFISFTQNTINNYIKAILYCPCKWGPCSYDTIPQNANTCEGIMALILASQNDTYADLINQIIINLAKTHTNSGIKSKSLGAETVVPTSMYLYICKKYGIKNLQEETNNIANYLWDARCDSGWGLYVKNMDNYTNIGCTYWAIMGLDGYTTIPDKEFYAYIRSLFKYRNTYTFGRTIDDVNPRIPFLYSTSMMYIIYMLLSEVDKLFVGSRYNKTKALNYIMQNFDNPFYMVEQEGISGVNLGGTTSVHTVNWNHITIHYSLFAISLAISNGEISPGDTLNILNRVKKIITENSEPSDGRLYWSAPNMTLEKGNRGKMIFPTMHFVMGLSFLRGAINDIINKKDVETDE